MTSGIPPWVLILVAVLGLLGTIIGAVSAAVITQRRSDKRETAQWERLQEQQRATWAREDKATHSSRQREAYLKLGAAISSQPHREIIAMSKKEIQIVLDAMAAVEAAAVEVEIYGSEKLREQSKKTRLAATRSAYATAMFIAQSGSPDHPPPKPGDREVTTRRFATATHDWMDAVRDEIGFDARPAQLPGAG